MYWITQFNYYFLTLEDEIIFFYIDNYAFVFIFI